MVNRGVPDQNGISQACYIVEIYHPGLESLKQNNRNIIHLVTLHAACKVRNLLPIGIKSGESTLKPES